MAVLVHARLNQSSKSHCRYSRFVPFFFFFLLVTLCRVVFKYDGKLIYAGESGTDYDDFIGQLGGEICVGGCSYRAFVALCV